MKLSILAYDIGTTGVKTCLYDFDNDKSSEMKLIGQAFASYGLKLLPNGGAEQDPDEWLKGLITTTQTLAQSNAEAINNLSGISFCSQMQSVVMVDATGKHLRPSMSYMDQRSGNLRRKLTAKGITIAGVNPSFLITSMRQTGVVSASDKDPIWKYLWVKEYEPHIYAKTHKWLDVKDALIARLTGKFTCSRDSAFATLLLNTDDDNPAFSERLIQKLGIDPNHMPTIIQSSDEAGRVLPEIANQLGIPAGTPVFSGGGDASLIGLGAGCSEVGDSHLYMGTSGWASVITDKRLVDLQSMIASVVGVQPKLFNYFAELETAGKCLEWVKDHLALDEINIYLDDKKQIIESQDNKFINLYDYMSEVINTAEAGSGGVIFTPWLHGNRCPFEDANVRAMFYNIGLNTGKTEMIRAVIEGVSYHLKWFVETVEHKLSMSDPIRFVGGGALSPVTAQILADILERKVEVVRDPQNVGAMGAALVVSVGLGAVDSLKETKSWVKIDQVYTPNSDNFAIYRKMYGIYKKLYKANKKLFAELNQTGESNE